MEHLRGQIIHTPRLALSLVCLLVWTVPLLGVDQRPAIMEDWLLRDAGVDRAQCFTSETDAILETKLVALVLTELGVDGEPLQAELTKLNAAKVPGRDPRWSELYGRAGERRRASRLQTVLAKTPRIVFTKHRTIRPSFFAYTEGQSDAQAERHFLPGSALCVLEMNGIYGQVRTLLEDKTGAIRDPAVSYDAKRVLFAWKKSLNEDDYHLYEMELATGTLRQITSGLGSADYEPAYLPNDDIVFASTRCVQTTDCFTTEVSNLYTCDRDGRFLRRLGFDQVHTVYPSVTHDGRVTYTRWDYNDRGQVFPQALFQMNPDGTGQTEFYGNNSWFPTTIAHARNVPGTQKMLAIFCGHHSSQAGKLGLIDPSKGRQENAGAQLVAPLRDTKAERIDSYGQQGELFQYPYPLNERECLVTYAPLGWDNPRDRRHGDADFGIYWMDIIDGRRELLVADPELPCNQPFPLTARRKPHLRPSHVDYRQTTGTYYMQDIYAGEGLAGVPRGAIKRLRVVGLDFRAAIVGANSSGGPAGGAMISTPVAIGNGTWDVKVVHGDATVYEDGSAFFTVPARTPVYFQALDAKGYAVQTMRSWSTLQPGETQSCVGCHEHKNTGPRPTGYTTLALKAGPQKLEPFYGAARGFSFPKEIQPILDRHCVSCHNDREAADRRIHGEVAVTAATTTNKVFSLLGAEIIDAAAKRRWSDSYLVLTQAQPDGKKSGEGRYRGDFTGKLVNWIGTQSVPSMLPPYFAGAAKSSLLTMLEVGHHEVRLSRAELERIACWIDLLVPFGGDYIEDNAWTDDEKEKYDRFLMKRRTMEELERRNIAALIASQDSSAGQPTTKLTRK